MKERDCAAQFYRDNLAQDLLDLRFTSAKQKAWNTLKTARKSNEYRVAKVLAKDDTLLTHIAVGELPYVHDQNGNEKASFGYYRSNEDFCVLEKYFAHWGGVGLAVGSDQGLDFMTMANLDEMFMIDIDAHTQSVTRMYLEVGTRLHKVLGRYPTTGEYISMFSLKLLPLTLQLLEAQSTRYTFLANDLDWLRTHFLVDNTAKEYLHAKHKAHTKASWVGNNTNLETVIRAYEEGRIHVSTGSIFGKVVDKISQQLKKSKKQVTLIYTSNAPTREFDIKKIKKLPLSEKALVLYSVHSGHSMLESAARCHEFQDFSFNWKFIVFSPHEAPVWPGVLNLGPFEKIRVGLYRKIFD